MTLPQTLPQIVAASCLSLSLCAIQADADSLFKYLTNAIGNKLWQPLPCSSLLLNLV